MLIERLQLTNLLSYGPDTETVDLGPLNILIGPNGSGKSNFLEALSLLQAAPGEITRPIRDGGAFRIGCISLPSSHIPLCLLGSKRFFAMRVVSKICDIPSNSGRKTVVLAYVTKLSKVRMRGVTRLPEKYTTNGMAGNLGERPI